MIFAQQYFQAVSLYPKIEQVPHPVVSQAMMTDKHDDFFHNRLNTIKIRHGALFRKYPSRLPLPLLKFVTE
ncbi:MAG: hypothetical protein R3E08_09150 [Thiotrichaceae bacterium]